MSFQIREPLANQLLEYTKDHENDEKARSTTASGNPLRDKSTSQTSAPRGDILLRDYEFFDMTQHFNRERIPERVVHAKGAGAYGYFEVTDDITEYSAAKVFAYIGKRTEIAVRFSQVALEMGSQDTVRDVRGFAIKFYTEDGNWDLVGNNTPVFFVQDCKLFPDLIHILKRNPTTHVRDWDMFWDFFSLRPESMHQVLIFYSDRGIPNGYRHMNGYGSNTFSLINADGNLVYCKFHYRTDQGISNLDTHTATKIAGANPDYALRDLYNSIASGNNPSWTFYIQVMTIQQANECPYAFDVTKVWPQALFPLIKVGKLVLDRNQTNYFAEIEQISFNPGSFIPGIDASPDKVLQGRLFAYGDASRYRLGVNYNQLPVNNPRKTKVTNFNRDGKSTFMSQGGAPNYHPNSYGGPEEDPIAKLLTPTTEATGKSGYYDEGFIDNFTQPGLFYRKVLNEPERTRLVDNIVNDLKNANTVIQNRNVSNFLQVDNDLGRRVEAGLKRTQFPQVDL